MNVDSMKPGCHLLVCGWTGSLVGRGFVTSVGVIRFLVTRGDYCQGHSTLVLSTCLKTL